MSHRVAKGRTPYCFGVYAGTVYFSCRSLYRIYDNVLIIIIVKNQKILTLIVNGTATEVRVCY